MVATWHKRWFLLLSFQVAGLLLAGQTPDASAWTWKGYVKNLQQWAFTGERNTLVNGGFFHNRLVLRYAPDTVWTFDAEVRNRLFYGEWVRLQPGLADGLAADAGLVDLPFVPVKRPALVGSIVADRLWAQWARGCWTLRLGRQRIHWGKALIWNPNDWFNTWNFLDFDYEERPGADALRLQYQAGLFSQFDLAVSPARQAKNWVGALRFGGHSGRFEWLASTGTGWPPVSAGQAIWGKPDSKAKFRCFSLSIPQPAYAVSAPPLK